ncbi:MAG: glycosyltransferase [Leptolyngbyaceae bacterium]|nr:glycosyltransferase [Leptolyngbyaceae bacterium]
MTVGQRLNVQSYRPQLTSVILLSIVLLTGGIVVAWFSGNGTIEAIFGRLNDIQEHPPMWAMTPMMIGEYFLFWTVSLMVVVLVIMRLSPRPTAWARTTVVGILGVLVVRYLLWRSQSTLNLDTPLNGVFSLGLFFLELLILINGIIQLVLLLRSRDRSSQADQLAHDVTSGIFVPSVDILIPTYNEPDFILKRTVMGCQAMEYPHKTIYLLDDSQRSPVKALAEILGCEYMARPDNRHAKAGNLNHAIPKTRGELIAVFDADFIPTKNFLTRTIGFFQDPNVGLVQTPQTYYNPDPIAWNLGMQDVLTPEEEVFYRQIQRLRDGAGGVVCAGTSFVVRRKAIEDVGGFVTEALSEDFFTGIQISAKGYRNIYLNEKLSAGLAAESIASHALQRIRWAQGTLQSFFISSNPLTIPGLKPMQRLAYFEGLLHWFSSIAKVGFLLMPLAYFFFGIIPLKATGEEILFFFVPYYLVQLMTFSWLNYRSRSALLSDVYALVLAFPLALTVIQVMMRPFAKGFKVTPKGNVSDRYRYNWQLAWPLIGVFILTAVSLWGNLGHCLVMEAIDNPIEHVRGLGIAWIWSAYNLLMLGIALLILLDAPRPSMFEWFDVRRIVKLTIGDQTLWGYTTMMSETGVEIALTRKTVPECCDSHASIELTDENLHFSGQIIEWNSSGEFPTCSIRFGPMALAEQRRLIEILYCRPGQWKDRCSPGELQSLWLIFKILLRPRVLVERKIAIRPFAVSKV